MKLFVILSILMVLALVSGSRLSAIKRRESKWDIIHHEYHGPPAPLSKDGRVIDTPEVAEAKANHLAIHAETVVDLAKKMAEANALEAKHKSEQASDAGASSETAAPIITQAVEMTPELMAMLLSAAAEEQQQQQQEQQQAEPAAPASEAAPEAAPAAEAATAEGGSGSEGAAPETPRSEEIKPIVESEITNEIDANNPIYILQRQYEGPLAPLDKDGRVIDTPEVIKAKQAHLLAFDSESKLSSAKEGESSANSLNGEIKQNDAGGEAPSWFELRKKLYVPPLHLVYRLNGPLGYKGAVAPIGNDGRVVDTEEVEKAKADHKKAYEHAEAIAKRHPPKPEDNSV